MVVRGEEENIPKKEMRADLIFVLMSGGGERRRGEIFVRTSFGVQIRRSHGAVVVTGESVKYFRSKCPPVVDGGSQVKYLEEK
ncbi:hypothetical protein CEXT_388381 [Caerostris extrusa]|uniref:Uncharacterized protein n=1 Tax=Caerostris extrusa TaxID=172846 RepID=A0AAV4SL96_CAEEX|nr:hypothetical protein CEXT_388381 [Caerostris extrusa]